MLIELCDICGEKIDGNRKYTLVITTECMDMGGGRTLAIPKTTLCPICKEKLREWLEK